MEGKINIVPGEAPESDDEDAGENKYRANPQGKAFFGEAPESDSSSSSQVDEVEDLSQRDISIESIGAFSGLTFMQPKITNSKSQSINVQYNSLLHKKLRERNASLRRNVEDFAHQTIETAARDVNLIDQHLLKSQVTLQEAATALRLLQSNLSQTHSKLNLALSSTYLPTIDVNSL